MRGHGLGTLLFQRALRRARNEGIEMLFIYTLMDNEAMLRIAHKLNMRVSNADGQWIEPTCGWSQPAPVQWCVSLSMNIWQTSTIFSKAR